MPSARRLASLLAAALLALAPAAAWGGGGAPQSKDQQKCIASFGAAAAGVAKARAAENERCLKAFGKGKLAPFGTDSLRSCFARDAKGKVAKQVAKLEKVAEKSCSAPGDVPDFGIAPGGAAPAAHQAREQATAPLLDVLSGFDELKLCTKYRLADGRETDRFVPDAEALGGVTPVYETFPGWTEEIRMARHRDELPENAQRYLDRIARGEFVIRPGKDCQYCDFRTLCRKSHYPTVVRAEEADDVPEGEEAEE